MGRGPHHRARKRIRGGELVRYPKLFGEGASIPIGLIRLRSHLRGTIGLSTRGRHTGDAQIFVNLLDNPRLDHNFTVFGEITSGMDVADAVLEGDVIERIDVLGG